MCSLRWAPWGWAPYLGFLRWAAPGGGTGGEPGEMGESGLIAGGG